MSPLEYYGIQFQSGILIPVIKSICDWWNLALDNKWHILSILTVFALSLQILFTSGGERFQNLSDNVSSNIFQINSNSKYITSYAISLSANEQRFYLYARCSICLEMSWITSNLWKIDWT